MDVNILIKNLSNIGDSSALAILDRYSQDNLEPSFISSEEICVGRYANFANLASSSVMTATAIDLPYSAPESDFSTIGAVFRCSIRKVFNIVRDIRPNLHFVSSQKNFFFFMVVDNGALANHFLKTMN